MCDKIGVWHLYIYAGATHHSFRLPVLAFGLSQPLYYII
jgi:hypothetical protein